VPGSQLNATRWPSQAIGRAYDRETSGVGTRCGFAILERPFTSYPGERNATLRHVDCAACLPGASSGRHDPGVTREAIDMTWPCPAGRRRRFELQQARALPRSFDEAEARRRWHQADDPLSAAGAVIVDMAAGDGGDFGQLRCITW
jgi:hypothetical protein